jgi:transposase
VRRHKAPADVKRAFRSLKTIDLYIRRIHHRLESRVRAHIFRCMLAF